MAKKILVSRLAKTPWGLASNKEQLSVALVGVELQRTGLFSELTN
ncbi:hypothetical protein HMPREF9176_1727 [Streptococcus downei F0415]|nr:hypothetical protein HMPREF9176_1727 [Streptococcus downei F0415]